MRESDPIDDTPLPPELQDAARAYHVPPPTPGQAIWREVQARRQGALPTAPLPGRPPARRYVEWSLAAAVLLAVGVGLGRLSTHGPQAGPVGRTPAASVPVARTPVPVARESPAYRMAAAEHLAQAEVFLTLFRASARSGGAEHLASATARELLASNRLLLDSPAGADPRLKLLLQDLELVLAQIAQISPQRGREDLDLISDGLERGGMLPRLRAAVPAGGPLSLRQGAL